MNPENPSLDSPSIVPATNLHRPEAIGEAQASGHPTARELPPLPESSSRGRGSSRRAPSPPFRSRRTLLGLGVVGLLFVLGLVGLLWFSGGLFARAPFNGPTIAVHKEKLTIGIVARGSLESARNGDIVCTVRSGTKGSTNSTVIKWLVDAGQEVKKGEKIMELDSSGFIEQLKDQNIKVDQAKADNVQADEAYHIQEIDNETDIEKAQNALDLARIDLEKYVKGDFEQALKDVEGRMKTARSDLEDWKDRAAWSRRMAKKGLMSLVQADADASRVEGSQINVEKLEEEKRVLVDYTKGRTVQNLTANLAEAKRGLAKAQGQARAKLAQAEATRLAKRSVYEQELSRKREIEGEIAKCQVYAPQDGLVVYFVPEQVKGGGGSSQSIVAQGEPVREGQKMMQIPDLSQMLVNVKVPEAFVSHLHSEDGDDKQYAQIRVDAFPNRILKGHIRTVDTIASQADWFASDVKFYKTMVTIDEQFDGLRPGMSAEVTIKADETPTPVLVVPVQAVVGTISSGAHRKCFVISADGQPVLRDIVVGMSNERKVEVREGLSEGEVVVENPRPLLGEDSDLKPGKVRTKSEEGESESGSGGGKKGRKKGGPAGPDGPTPGVSPTSPTPGPAPAAPAPGAGQASDAQKAQFMEKMRSASPQERRDMINQAPEAVRDRMRQFMREQKLEVAD